MASALFDTFDADGSETISFRELNKQLRRDVKVEKRAVEYKPVQHDIADVEELRKAARQASLSYAQSEVWLEDPLWGTKTKA